MFVPIEIKKNGLKFVDYRIWIRQAIIDMAGKK